MNNPHAVGAVKYVNDQKGGISLDPVKFKPTLMRPSMTAVA